MSKTNGTDTAFPVDGEYAGEALSKGTSGLTKREIFAAMAIEGIMNPDTSNYEILRPCLWFCKGQREIRRFQQVLYSVGNPITHRVWLH